LTGYDFRKILPQVLDPILAQNFHGLSTELPKHIVNKALVVPRKSWPSDSLLTIRYSMNRLATYEKFLKETTVSCMSRFKA
jgi:hypothetical protein